MLAEVPLPAVRNAEGTGTPNRTSLATAVSPAEREEISRGLKHGMPLRSIASTLGRAPSTISREVRVNGRHTRYRAWWAERQAVRLLTRPYRPKLARNTRLLSEAERFLTRLWSPEQISAHLQRACRDDAAMRISHEVIYQALFVQGRGALRKELKKCVRIGRAISGQRAAIPGEPCTRRGDN